MLEKHPLVREFLPESLLWKRRKNEDEKLCDGEFWYAVPGRDEAERVGLEVELTLKNKDRLAESFDQLSRRGLDQVWWLCGDETILKALRHQVIERPWQFDGQRHLFCLLDEFLSTKELRHCFIDAGGQEFTIDPAAPTLLPRNPEPPPPPRSTPAVPPPQIEGEMEWLPVAPAPATSPAPTAGPERSDNPVHRYLSRLDSFAGRALVSLWRWLRESWSVYECYSGRRIWSFHRWPHVCAVAGLGVAFFVHRAAPALMKEAAAIVSPTRPAPAWTKRRVREYGIDQDGWVLYPRSLKSSGNRYRFEFGLTNMDSFDDGICAASIQDARGKTFASRTWREVFIQRGHEMAPNISIEFTGPKGMDHFFVVVSGGLSNCGKIGQGKSFLVQFD